MDWRDCFRASASGDNARPARDLGRYGGGLEDAIEAGVKQKWTGGTEVVTANIFVKCIKCVSIVKPRIWLLFPRDIVDFAINSGPFCWIEFMTTLFE
jgi:hypothetical protein